MKFQLPVPLSNGYNGKRSTDNPDSLLAKLVQYVAIGERQGTRPTRSGFARVRHSQKPTNYGKNLIRLAVKLGVIEITSERAGKHGKVLRLGVNAQSVKTRLGVLNNFR